MSNDWDFEWCLHISRFRCHFIWYFKLTMVLHLQTEQNNMDYFLNKSTFILTYNLWHSQHSNGCSSEWDKRWLLSSVCVRNRRPHSSHWNRRSSTCNKRTWARKLQARWNDFPQILHLCWYWFKSIDSKFTGNAFWPVSFNRFGDFWPSVFFVFGFKTDDSVLL